MALSGVLCHGSPATPRPDAAVRERSATAMAATSTNVLVQRIMDEASRCRAYGWEVQMFPDNCGHWTLTMPIGEDVPSCPCVAVPHLP